MQKQRWRIFCDSRKGENKSPQTCHLKPKNVLLTQKAKIDNSMPVKYSRLQISVFNLYRRLIRASEGRPGFKEYLRTEFRENAKIPRSNILRIEYLIRTGEKQLKDLQKSELKSISVFKM